MDEKKERTSKKINIKNKKEATKALSKTTTQKKKKITTKKQTTKQAAKKKNQTKKVVKVEPKKEQIVVEEKEQLKTKEEKLKTKKEPVKSKKETTKKVTPKKKEEKTKLVLPKEWEQVNKQKERITQETNTNLKGKLKSSLFEEVDEKTYEIKKQKEKETLKKTLLTILIVVSIVVLLFFIIIKFNDNLKESLKMYDHYYLGDKVKLEDNSIWYVVDDSDASEKTVKLLKENNIDINNDKVFDDNDKKKYNSDNLTEYDVQNEDSAALYLNETYKKELEKSIGKVQEVNLLTSKEYVKLREKMNFGYEWMEGNWLANKELGNWWIISEQNGKVYAVTLTGTYKLYSANSLNFVRPVIVVDKELVTLLDDSNE